MVWASAMVMVGMGIVAFTQGIAWCMAALAAFPAGIVTAALLVEVLAGPRRPVEVALAGAEISDRGGRFLDFASPGVLFSQVCEGVCDQVSLTFPDHRGAQFHSWIRTAEQACISCAEGDFGKGDAVCVGAEAPGAAKRGV